MQCNLVYIIQVHYYLKYLPLELVKKHKCCILAVLFPAVLAAQCTNTPMRISL